MSTALTAPAAPRSISPFVHPAPDLARIEAGVREILFGLGENPHREGLVETPSRVARSLVEMLAGLSQDPAAHLARQFEHESTGSGDLVACRGIEFTSLCEHHLLPFVGVAHVAYLPGGSRVVGLSKLARTVDTFARRPQMQERLTSQIADALDEHLEPRGVAVIIESEHSCLRLRGAAKREADMLTTAFRGTFESDRSLRAEVTSMLLGSRGRGR